MGKVLLLNKIDPPEDVVERLQRIDSHLGLRFVEFPPDEDGNRPRWWALTWTWPKDDQRYRRIHSGEIPIDMCFDVIGYLPLDCDVTTSFEYAKNLFYAKRNDPNVKRLLDRLDAYNSAQTEAVREAVEERAAETMEANSRTLFQKVTGKNIPKVFQSRGQ